jgi:adenylate kinase family enzyme
LEKSTFARLLSDRTELPIVELDKLYWAPGWKPVDPDTFRRRVLENTSSDGWIVVGNYGAVRDTLWPRATTVLWLNYGFALTFSRAMRRTVRRAVTREELWNGNRESIRRSFFSRESILWWVITTHRRRREEFTRLRDSAEYRHLRWVEFRRPSEAERYARDNPACSD